MKILIIVIENLILALVKFWTIASYALAAFLDDYIYPLTTIQKIVTAGTGIAIAIATDLLVNFVIYKSINRKEKLISYKKLIAISLVITILEILFILPF